MDSNAPQSVIRQLRIFLLLLVLFIVAVGTWLDRVYSTDWDGPLIVALYPINADGSDNTAAYLQRLRSEQFQTLEQFFDEERSEYGIELERPMRFSLTPQLSQLPPTLGRDPNVLQVMAWSLRLRWWAKFSVPRAPGPTPTIRLFLLYHDPARHSILAHSIGLQKGLIGVVNLFAHKDMKGSNDTVIAHELLHTLGASDKYDLRTTLPLHPVGFAEPARRPLYPQQYAELMGGRIPLSAAEARIPESLQEVLIGPATAIEIGWRK